MIDTYELQIKQSIAVAENRVKCDAAFRAVINEIVFHYDHGELLACKLACEDAAKLVGDKFLDRMADEAGVVRGQS